MGSERRRRRPTPGSSELPGEPFGPQGPVRTCLGCRRRSAQATLLRLIGVGLTAGADNGPWRLLPDPTRRAPGRGAYVHPDLACVQNAVQRRAFGRALRRGGPPDTTDLMAWMATHLS